MTSYLFSWPFTYSSSSSPPPQPTAAASHDEPTTADDAEDETFTSVGAPPERTPVPETAAASPVTVEDTAAAAWTHVAAAAAPAAESESSSAAGAPITLESDWAPWHPDSPDRFNAPHSDARDSALPPGSLVIVTGPDSVKNSSALDYLGQHLCTGGDEARVPTDDGTWWTFRSPCLNTLLDVNARQRTSWPRRGHVVCLDEPTCRHMPDFARIIQGWLATHGLVIVLACRSLASLVPDLVSVAHAIVMVDVAPTTFRAAEDATILQSLVPALTPDVLKNVLDRTGGNAVVDVNRQRIHTWHAGHHQFSLDHRRGIEAFLDALARDVRCVSSMAFSETAWRRAVLELLETVDWGELRRQSVDSSSSSNNITLADDLVRDIILDVGHVLVGGLSKVLFGRIRGDVQDALVRIVEDVVRTLLRAS